MEPHSHCGVGSDGSDRLGCNLLVGYNARRIEGKIKRFFILPLIVSVAFFLIAEMDSPRHGVIRVSPQNLIRVSQSMRAL